MVEKVFLLDLPLSGVADDSLRNALKNRNAANREVRGKGEKNKWIELNNAFFKKISGWPQGEENNYNNR